MSASGLDDLASWRAHSRPEPHTYAVYPLTGLHHSPLVAPTNSDNRIPTPFRRLLDFTTAEWARRLTATTAYLRHCTLHWARPLVTGEWLIRRNRIPTPIYASLGAPTRHWRVVNSAKPHTYAIVGASGFAHYAQLGGGSA